MVLVSFVFVKSLFLIANPLEYKKMTITPFFSLTSADESNRNFPLLQNPCAVALNDQGQIYVLDRGAMVIHKYSLEKKFLKTIGRMGQGPGEFFQPQTLIVSGSYLWVSDYGNGRIQIFKDDKYLKTLRVEKTRAPKNLVTIDNKVYVTGPSIDQHYGPLSVFSHNGDYQNELPWFPNRNKSRGKTAPLWNRITVEPFGEKKLLIGYLFDNAISIIDIHGQLIREVKMTTFYGIHETKRGDDVMPAGYSAMSFSAGPENSVLITICNQEERQCATIYRFNEKLNRLIGKMDLHASVNFMRYYDQYKMLVTTNKHAEVVIYAVN